MHAGGGRVSGYALYSLCRRALFGSAAGVLAVEWLAGCGRAAADTSGLSGLSGNYASQAWAMRWWIPISGGIALVVTVLAGVMLVRRLRSGRDDSPPTGAEARLARPPAESEAAPETESSAPPEGGVPAPTYPDGARAPERIPVPGPPKAAPVMDPRSQFERANAAGRVLGAGAQPAAQRYEDIHEEFGRNSAEGTIKDLVYGPGGGGGPVVDVGLRRWPAGEEAAWEKVVATGWFQEAGSGTIGSAVERAK
jgi:hypothetical protein